MELLQPLNVEPIKIKKGIAIQNVTLFRAAEDFRNNCATKHKASPNEFKRDDWKVLPDLRNRLEITERFNNLCSRFNWLSLQSLPVIAMFHGTIEPTAKKICESGFGTVATLDDGWYGKGIYFTSSLDYALFYAQKAKESFYSKPENRRLKKPSYDVIIMSLVTLGNTFPVTENPNSNTWKYLINL